MSNFSDPLIITWHVDGSGNKISLPITNINHTVINGRFLLDYIPDEFYKVTINTPSDMVEIDIGRLLTSNAQYKVDYTNGLVYVHSDLEGDTINASYYSRGIISYPASRVYTESTGENITETLQEKIDSLLTIGTEYDNAETDRVNAENTRVSNENTRISNENTRVSNENTRISNEANRIVQWNELEHEGEFNIATTYEKYNIVNYNGSSYMAVQQAVGAVPTNTAYWKLIAANGNNFTPRGIYNGGTAYSQYDIVTYQNSLYMAKSSTTGNVPTNDTYWDLYLTLSTIDTLYLNTIADTTVETTYSGSELTTIVWKDATTTDTIRTDTFTYDSDVSTETITELRTLAGTGETLEIVSVFDLDGNFISGDSTSNV
jgi:hypothetical protein